MIMSPTQELFVVVMVGKASSDLNHSKGPLNHEGETFTSGINVLVKVGPSVSGTTARSQNL